MISGKKGGWDKKTYCGFAYINPVASADANLSTSQSKTDEVTLYFNDVRPAWTFNGRIKRIHFRLDPTNAVTYTLRIWSGSNTNDYQANLMLLWESPAARAGATDYDECELDIPFICAIQGRLYYSIEWSGATGNIAGFIHVSGETQEAP